MTLLYYALIQLEGFLIPLVPSHHNLYGYIVLLFKQIENMQQSFSVSILVLFISEKKYFAWW